MDRWLSTAARQSNERDTVRVYVVCDDSDVVVAYSALVVGTLSKERLPSRARSGLPAQVPGVLLVKLAVDRSQQEGAGLGGVLLGHAARSALAVRRLAGARLLFTEARDEAAKNAKKWYVSKGMDSLGDSLFCYTRLKDLA